MPINHHLVGPEIAYIVDDCEAKVFVGHERFADEAVAAAERDRLPAGRAASPSARSPGFRPFAELKAGQPTDLPTDRTAGAVMNYTSGTTGRPKGVRRALSGCPPRHVAATFGGLLLMFGAAAGRRQRAHRRLAALPHGRAGVRRRRPCTSATRWCSWTSGRRRGCSSSSSATGSPAATWCRRSSTGSWPFPTRSAPPTTCPRCATWSTPPPRARPDVKRRMIEWWGDAIEEYYAASEGGGTTVIAEEWMS